MNKTEQCPEFPHFGAPYPDARCHNGYLWDLDSSEDDGLLYNGGDDPCPFCNTEAYLEWAGVDPEDPEAPTRKEMLARIEATKKRYS